MWKSIHFKVSVLVLILISGTAFSIIYYSLASYRDGRSQVLREMNRSLALSLNRNTNLYLTSLKNKLSLFSQVREDIFDQENYTEKLFENTPDFLLVGKIMKKNTEKWQPLWVEKNQKIPQFNRTDILALLKNLPLGQLSMNEMTVFSIKDPLLGDVNAYIFLQDGVANNFVFGLSSADFLSNLLIPFKGTFNSANLINNEQKIIGFSNGIKQKREGIQKLFNDNRYGMVSFDPHNKNFSTLESVQGTNLYTLVSTPESLIWIGQGRHIFMMVLIVLGFFLLSAGALFWIFSMFNKTVFRLNKSLLTLIETDENKPRFLEVPEEFMSLKSTFLKITEARKANEIEKEKTHVKEVIREKQNAYSRLSLGLVNTLKEPLAAMIGHSQILMDKINTGRDPAKNAKFLEKEARKTKEIVESLLVFNNLEKTDLESLDIHEVINSALNMCEHRFSLMDLTVDKKLQSGEKIIGNSLKLQQAIFNILINAAQSMENKVIKKISIQSKSIEGFVEISIRDFGCGIAPQIENQIFEPFFTTKIGNNMGLGLSLSLGIIESHRGEIQINHFEDGTEFIIRIPDLNNNEKSMRTSEINPSLKSVATVKSYSPPNFVKEINDPVLDSFDVNSKPDLTFKRDIAQIAKAIVESEKKSEQSIEKERKKDKFPEPPKFLANEDLSVKIRKPLLKDSSSEI